MSTSLAQELEPTTIFRSGDDLLRIVSANGDAIEVQRIGTKSGPNGGFKSVKDLATTWPGDLELILVDGMWTVIPGQQEASN